MYVRMNPLLSQIIRDDDGKQWAAYILLVVSCICLHGRGFLLSELTNKVPFTVEYMSLAATEKDSDVHPTNHVINYFQRFILEHMHKALEFVINRNS